MFRRCQTQISRKPTQSTGIHIRHGADIPSKYGKMYGLEFMRSQYGCFSVYFPSCEARRSSHSDPVSHSFRLRSADDVTIDCWRRHKCSTWRNEHVKSDI